ncbi:ephrin type-B receptor 6-like [Actinia tenebrosa]|uniref:Ephrin type-B receptor 6-like n=1 Tax=Actinia tenebrosa TaxID=6105 RepID=A0A6P8I6R9_ACTTE|nr:ephrin type-B receptor 6-like [Actinia tenebrosa]XP_031560421.1 ephrin type-B receptor 6-like [Actinia tenebrosa]
MYPSQKNSLFLALVVARTVAAVLGYEEILMNYAYTDPAWQWVTKYRLAEGNGWARDSQTGKYITCDIPSTKTNSTNSWMISDYVPLNNANAVHLSITFTARHCDLASYPFCKNSIGLYILESDIIEVGGITMEAILAGNFSNVADAIASNVWTDRNNIPENVHNVSFPTTKKGIYLAFRDTGACVALVKVRMTSYQCPSVVSGGAVFNKTASPMPGLKTKVKGECLGMSENLANGSSLYLGCYSNGTWSSNLRVTCQCKAGYQPGDRVCQACPDGSYKPTTGNTMCVPCPVNSYSNTTRTGCLCSMGYYRTNSDPPNGKCTAPPSSPRDLSSTLIGPRFVLLSWQRPLNDGGHNDLLYSIDCYRCNHGNTRDYDNSRNVSRYCNQSCESTLRYTPSANKIPFTHVTIFGLAPGFSYLFRVTAENGVSRLGTNVTDNYTEVSTSIPNPVVPKLIVSFVGSDVTVLSWSSKEDNQSTSFFYYSVSCAACDKELSDCITSCNTACGNAIQYLPRKDQIEGSFAVVSQLKEATKYKFKLSVTERDSDGYRSDTSVVCVTTKNSGNAAEVNGQRDQGKDISLYSKIALGVSGGFLLLSIVLLMVTVCLRNKWYRQAKSMHSGSSASAFSYTNELKPIENLVFMEETNLENVRQN